MGDTVGIIDCGVNGTWVMGDIVGVIHSEGK